MSPLAARTRCTNQLPGLKTDHASMAAPAVIRRARSNPGRFFIRVVLFKACEESHPSREGTGRLKSFKAPRNFLLVRERPPLCESRTLAGMALLMAMGNMGNFIAFVYFLSRPKPPWQHLLSFAVGGYVGFRFAYHTILEQILWDGRWGEAPTLSLLVCTVGYIMLGGTLAVVATSACDQPSQPASEEDWTVKRKDATRF